MPRRAGIYIDFDNFISGLIEAGGDQGLRVARSPSVWISHLTRRFVLTDDRRWLVRRCYMNPGGFKIDAGLAAGHSGDFESFRSTYVNAGCEVVDCPDLTTNGEGRSKNAADIRLAVDVMDALQSPVPLDEFVIVSGDSDFTPLLHRLRAADRQTTVIAPGPVAAGYRAAADRFLAKRKLGDVIRSLELPQTELTADRLRAVDSGGLSG